MTTHCKSLIKQLLEKKEGNRLGSKSGASEVKMHPFFKMIKFALLRHMTPPIIPNTANSHFVYKPQYNHKDSGSLDLDAEDESIMIADLGIHSQDPFAKFNSGTQFALRLAYMHLTLYTHSLFIS